ncbi:MAG: DMT family transporter [Acidobacteria bacterium]|nr:DMT family transporter [Acidobacteriota bacterium]
MKMPKLVQAEIALILITLVWGSTFTIVKKGLQQVSPILFVALRFWIAAAVVAAAMPGQLRRINRKTALRGAVLSLALLGGFVLQTLGLRDTTPSNSAFITSLCVLLVPVLGFSFYRRKPPWRTVSGILLATFGLILLLADSSDFGLHSGDFLTLMCAFLFALHILLLGRYVKSSDYRHLILVKMLCGAVLCSILAPVLETPFVVWDSYFVFYLFILGVLATALAFFVQGWAQQYSNPNHTALIFSLEPVFAALFAFWILNQGWTLKEWAGGILILSGILVAEIRIKGKPQAWPESPIRAR